MIRLLIVDDEPYTVDGLYEMLDDRAELDLDLYRAYSPEEAMDWLMRTRMDIVLSDIRMPGMSGLELQRRIAEHWPRCKIVFLTGIRDLQMAQQAMRTGSIDYILKTEGDEAILRGIRKAMDELSLESRSEQIILQAKEQMRLALPLLHREWLAALLDPAAGGSPQPARMQDLGIPLDAGEPLSPVLARVDRWDESLSGSDRTLLMYALQNIASELFATVVCFPVHLDANHLLLLLQPAAGRSEDGVAAAAPLKASFVQGTVESLQDTCGRLLGLTLSFVSTAYPICWKALPAAYADMRRKLLLGLGAGTGMLLTVEPHRQSGPASMPSVRTMVKKLERLLEERLEEPFSETLKQFLEAPASHADYMQAYYAAATLLLSAAEAELSSAQEPPFDAETLLDLPAHRSRERADRTLLLAAAALFAKLRELRDERTHQVLDKLHGYIREQLDGDLSLTRLAEVANLNPTYLSVLYKQCTGHNLSDHIARLRLEKAKELLAETPLKIHEIAERVGFGTAGYFIRFFKKRLNVTPQEFRSSH
ncbi:response regulator transcription factor [Cohnella zeiphila]|uniref:Response regulator n=1 Tax=Cohnella zeiphila TaxID=2761120 RepID=A0A7X0VUA4_9BACL|nr:response regulator [Cohnella zeiphila]MBB6730180.1 response regulator [Cohnella zeiphila]